MNKGGYILQAAKKKLPDKWPGAKFLLRTVLFFAYGSRTKKGGVLQHPSMAFNMDLGFGSVFRVGRLVFPGFGLTVFFGFGILKARLIATQRCNQFHLLTKNEMVNLFYCEDNSTLHTVKHLLLVVLRMGKFAILRSSISVI